MRSITFQIIIFFILVFLMGGTSFAQCRDHSSGIGFRMSFWRLGNNNSLKVSEFGNSESVVVGGVGFGINYYSQVSYDTFFELSINAVARVEENEHSYYSEYSNINFVLPITFGLRKIISLPDNIETIEPYLALGGGPYLSGHVKEDDTFDTEEVMVKSFLGMYAGGGVNFFMSSWFGVSFDIKYHLVNLDINSDYSDFDIGMGINFRW